MVPGPSAAPPEPAPPSAPDALTALLVREFDLSAGEQLRLYAVQAALARRGVRPTDPSLARWLSPVFCTSPEEQARFLLRFEEVRAAVAPAPTRLGWPGRLRKDGSGQPEAPAADTTPPPERVHARRLPLLFALIGLVGLLVVGLIAVLAAGVDIALPLPGNTPAPSSFLPASEVATRYQRVAAGWGLKLELGTWALLGLIPLGLGLALSGVLLLRLRRQRRAFRPTPELSRPIALKAALPEYFSEAGVLRSLLNLARHRQSPSARLNLRRSLRATARSAGYPILRYGAQPTVPGYLLLIDRESPRDHLPLLGDMLARALGGHHVALTRYGFHRRPTLLSNLDNATDPPATFDELVSILPNARVLILAEADCLVQTSGTLADWLQAIAGTGKVCVLDPRAEADWADDEAALRRGGLLVLPATPDGVRRYADWLVAPGVAAVPPRRGTPGLDVPFQLSRFRARLLSDEPLPDELMAGLLRDLRGWLGEDLMRLMRALAVFPRLEPSLTLALGKALRTAYDQPVLSDDTLLRIVRLPWLRAGRMPDQLRRHLAEKLSPKDLAATVTIVHAFLVSEAAVLRDGAMRPPRRADLLAHWLRTAADTDLHDPVLIDAVEGRGAQQLGTPPDTGMAAVLHRFSRSPAQIAATAAALAALVFMWLQPLYRDQALPELPASVPPAATSSPTPTPEPSMAPSPTPSAVPLAVERATINATSAAPNTANQIVGGDVRDGWDIDVFWCAGKYEQGSYAAARAAAGTIASLSIGKQRLAPGVRLGRIRLRVLSVANQKSGLFYRGRSNYVVEDGSYGEVEAAAAVASVLSASGTAYSVKTNIRTKTQFYLSVFSCGDNSADSTLRD